MRGRGLCVLLGVLGCGSSVPVTPTPQADGGRRADAARRVDTDGDGLCDDTEARQRTSPMDADTDGDGLLDSLEVALGTNPLSSLDPSASDRLTVTESSMDGATSEQFLDYQGTMGEVVGGAIQDRGLGTDGRAALGVAGFTVVAVDANPAAFVAGIVGPQFVGVLGETTLHWRVTVQPLPEAGQLGCRRGYGFTFVVRRPDGVADSHPMVLDVLPVAGGDGGASGAGPDGGGPWPRVSPAGLCLPAPPCV